MSCFTTGGPGKEQGTNKPPPTRRVRERSEGDTTCPTSSQNPSLWHPSWLNKACTTRKDSESEWLAKDNPETNPVTIKPKTASHETQLFSWVPLPYCSLPGCPFPIKSPALSADVSPRTIHFWVLDKSPVSGPGRGPLSCNNWIFFLLLPAQSHPSRLPQSTEWSLPRLPTSHFLMSSLYYYYYPHVLLQSLPPYPLSPSSLLLHLFSLKLYNHWSFL